MAISTTEREFTYSELAEAAARIHAVLASHGVRRGDGVGLMFEEPFEQIAAILGVLRAGAYYVFLDANFPEARLRQIAADGVVTMVLADSERSALAHSLVPAGVPVVVASPAKNGSATPPAPTPVDAHELAYVAYTSGSTGMPKGVMHPHANVMHEAAVHRVTLNLQPDDRSTLLYSLGVTGSVRDLFATLFVGARLCPFPFQTRGFVELEAWLRAQRVTQFHSVPSIFRELVRVVEPYERLDCVRVVYVAGDSVSPEDVAHFRRHFSPTARFYTGIGATETSSIYTHWFVEGDGPWPQGRLPSGWPVPQKDVRLVGDDRRPSPAGEAGEIAVGGAYLASGYWRRPALSAAVFDEAADGSAGRTYYTGDYGYFDAAGRMVHLGRRDQQVKINGQRVELGEIEHALCDQPGITGAVVRVVHENIERPRIVAYVVAPATAFEEKELRARLSLRVSSAAMPTVIMRLDTLPRTSTGKIDYAELPAPRSVLAGLAPDELPELWTPAERRVLEVWREIFPGLREYRRDDTFERLGGDSLEAVRLVELLRRRLKFASAVSDFVRAETISTLAARMTASMQGAPSGSSLEHDIEQLSALATSWKLPELAREVASGLPVFVVGEDRPGVPLVWFGQMEMGLQIGRTISRHRPVYLIPSAAAAGPAAMERICIHLGARLAPHLPRRVMCGGCCYSGLQAMLLARALQAEGRDVDALFLLDAFGSTRSRRLQYQLFRIQALRQRVRDTSLLRVLREDFTRIARWFTHRVAGQANAGAVSSPLDDPAYLTGFVPFGYDGAIVHILSANAAWIRRAIPRLGWGAIESTRAETHLVPGDHTDLWVRPTLFDVEAILETVAARADGQVQRVDPQRSVTATADASRDEISVSADEPVLGSISDTARWVAVYRAWESRQPDAIFRDPLAERLAGKGGERIVEKLGAGWMACSFIVRTAVIDDFIRRAVADGVDTVLNLAAGLDTRPYRIELPPSLHWIEVDLPAITAYKDALLAGETPHCRLTRIVHDLTDGAATRTLFARIATEARKVLVITEGLLVYLPEPVVIRLANDLAAQPVFAYWVQDFLAPDVLASLNKSWGKVLGEAKSQMVFAPPEGADFYNPHGWRPKDVRYFGDEVRLRRLERRFTWRHEDATHLAPTTPQRPFVKWPGYALLERSRAHHDV